MTPPPPPSRREFLGTALALPAALSAPAVAAGHRQAGPPAVLDMPLIPQPEPKAVLVSTIAVGGETVLAVVRIWEPRDVGRCRLCPRSACSVDRDDRTCLVLSTEPYPVDDRDLPMHTPHHPMPPRIGRPNREDVRG